MKSLIVAILAIFALVGLVIGGLGGGFHRGSPTSAAIISADLDLKSFESALEQYKIASGAYPSEEQGLNAFVVRPKIAPLPDRWVQMYDEIEPDPWETPYRYHFPGKQNPTKPEIISAGPDKIFGTEDDLSNQDS